MRWSEEQLQRYEMRRAPKVPQVEPPNAALESKLHKEIEAELNRRRWYFTHSRMDQRTTNTLGTPDFIIAIPAKDTVRCRTLWLECKRKGEKLTKEQQITRHILLAAGHWYEVVYSFGEFMRLL